MPFIPFSQKSSGSADLGNLLGTGLSGLASGFSNQVNQGLDMLAQRKMMQLQQNQLAGQQHAERQRYASGLAPLLGKETASFLSNLNPEERKYALQNIGGLMQLQELQGLGQPESATSGAYPQQFLPQQQQMPEEQAQRQQEIQRMAQQQGITPEQIAQVLNPFGKQSAAQQPPVVIAPQEQPQPKRVISQAEKAKLIQDIFTSPQEKREREKLELKRQQLALQETKAYTNTVLQQEKGAKENDLRLKRMEKLIEKGKLPNANLWSFLSKIEDTGALSTGGVGALIGGALGSVVPGAGTAVGAGVGTAVGGLIGSMASPLAGSIKSSIRSGTPDIEEFEKLSADFVKNAKQFFGSRLTDADLRAYMQTIPNLMQTDAGKKKVIENLRSVNDMAKIEAKALRDILKENDGNRPIDLEQQVQDRISKDIDKLAEQFITH